MKMHRDKRAWLVFLTMLILTTFTASLGAAPESEAFSPAAEGPNAAAEASGWCLAGDFNSWDNGGLPLYDDGTNGDIFANDNVFSLDYSLASAGRNEWKIFQCGTYDIGFPAQNSWVNTSSANQTVKFTFETNDHSADAGAAFLPAQNIVNAGDDLPTSFTAVGDFNGWNNADPNTLMTDEGNGIYRLAYQVAAAGSYIGKVTSTGSWDAFGADGRSKDAANVNFSTSSANGTVIFLLDTKSGRVSIAPNGSGGGNWCLAGGFQGWNNAANPMFDDGTNGDLLGGDGVYTLDFNVPNAGREEWKVVECGNWDNAYPGDNAWVITGSAGQLVKFTFDTNDHSGDAGLPLIPMQNIANAWDDLPGSFTVVGPWQGWANDSAATVMTSLGNQYFLLDYPFAAPGMFEAKISETNNWDNQIGADGRNKNAPTVNFEVFAADDVVQFLLDGSQGRWAIVTPPNTTGAAHDNNIWWNDLGHNSRDTLYRTPGGPQVTSTPVTLRLRAAANDLTAAKVRVWDDLNNVQQLIDMHLAANDGTYEWWEAEVPASADPTLFWYRFIAIDGTATAYYEDDASRDGGWGQTYGSSPDQGWQITIYDPAFQTPDWVKDGVIYQIFPDRFRDGNPANNTPEGSFFYNEAGTITRSNDPGEQWNAPICDPRDATSDCPDIYSQNFYGGDLQGILDQLDNLQDLGITILYLNPIFESPSNHKYDTTDYLQIDDNFGDEALFDLLVAEAHNRGINVVLDGVFNHTSSDSIYFDRYGRYPAPDGACESETSTFRSWYYFSPANPAGTGPCAGDSNYEAWFGYDSLPKLNSSDNGVRDLIWQGGSSSVARHWMETADGWRLDVAGDVDPGLTNDPANDYWEGFRTTVHTTKPDAYIVAEEWGNASPWLLGDEMDATMNYQYGSAMLSFWRDTPLEDNDHNSGSSAGILAPLTPSQLDGRLQNWQERYPAEAYYAMMNLLDSHDTNRALFLLDHNAATSNNDALLQDPNYDWSDAIARLKGVVLLQMTLPGAPTIYYGDEVGLVGPSYYHGSRWEDDPYNRVPYPWLDQSGTPFYTHLQSQAGQDDLRDYYQQLIAIRENSAALRTGSFDTLLTDDANDVYAYGRLMADYSDAAVVIVNRATTAQPVALDLSGYLPFGAQFVDALNGGSYNIDGSGLLSLASVPPMSGAVLVLDSAIAAPPEAVTDLSVSDVRSQEVDLTWSAAPGADSYDVYRSLVSGGGYSFVTNTAGTSFTDTGLTTTTTYFYVVIGRNDTSGLVSDNSNEVQAIPSYELGWYNLQSPPTLNHTISTSNPTDTIYGQVWIDGVTNQLGPTPGLLAQVGYGAVGSTPDDSWTWVDMSFNVDSGNNDEFMGNFLPDQVGIFDYVTRYSGDGGNTWHYGDLNGPVVGVPSNPGKLTVVPSGDTTAPATPTNLNILGTTSGSINLGWDAHPNTDGDLAGFELYRENVAAPGYSRVARILDPLATSYDDLSVTSGQTYNYYLLAYDTSFNRSDSSNIVQATAEPRLVSVTFRVGVPVNTPGTVYLVGDLPELGPWNPGLVPMTQVDDTTWEHTIDILDGTTLPYKYTRGSWDTVESWGSIVNINNRSLTIVYGSDGTQLVDNTAVDWGSGPDDEKAVQYWRDPFVVDFSPEADAVDVPWNTAVAVVWSIPVDPDTTFEVNGPGGLVSGSFAYDANSQTVTFTPDSDLAPGTTYDVLVSGATSPGVPNGDTGTQQVPVSWSFTTMFQPVDAAIQDLIDQVNELVDQSVLNNGQGNALKVKLEGALDKYERGQYQVAVNRLNAFINQVEAYINDGILSQEVGQNLIDQAQVVIKQIEAGG